MKTNILTQSKRDNLTGLSWQVSHLFGSRKHYYITKAVCSSEGTICVGFRNGRPPIIDPQTLENVCGWKKIDIPKNRNSFVFGTPTWCENTLYHASFLFDNFWYAWSKEMLYWLVCWAQHFSLSIHCVTGIKVTESGVRTQDSGLQTLNSGDMDGVTYSQLHGAHSITSRDSHCSPI